MEASRLVGHGKRPKCKVSVTFFALFVTAQGFLACPGVRAQSESSAPAAQTESVPAASPAQTAPAAPQPQAPATTQTPEERARIIREAQARIMARRQARVAQTIRETYGSKYELYFGGGYLRFKPGDTKQKVNEAVWNVGVTDYIRPRLGLTVDVRGIYGTAYIGNNPYGIFLPAISQYSFLFGPQYRVYAKPKWAISVQGLAGIGHGNFDTGTGGLPASYLGLYNNGTVFNMSLSAPMDYNLGPGLAIRITPTYLLTNYGSSIQNNLGFNAGVVYRWGKQ